MNAIDPSSVSTQPIYEQASLRHLLVKEIPGIGPARARNLVSRFGDDLDRAIGENDPDLETILPTDVIAQLTSRYQEITQERDLAIWLDQINIDRKIAFQIISSWGGKSALAIKNNPYLLTMFAGFHKADSLGQAAGINQTDPRRIVASVEAALATIRNDGHTWANEEKIVSLASSLLHLENGSPTLSEAIDKAINARVAIRFANGIQGLGSALMERELAETIKAKQTNADTLFTGSITPDKINSFITKIETDNSIRFDGTQKAAIELPLRSQIACIAGYAGTGKTTVLRTVFDILNQANLTPHPMALAGRAARRLEQATNVPARTIASVQMTPLAREISKTEQGLETRQRPFNNQDVLVIDEASMVDLPTIWDLIRKIPQARILLVGDPAQLAPIGAGKPFHELVNTIPTVTLDRIYRQEKSSGIPSIAEQVRNGIVPDLSTYSGPAKGVFFCDCKIEHTAKTAIEISKSLSSQTERGQLRILSPRRNNVDGVKMINNTFSQWRGADRLCFPGASQIRIGDPVMFLKNDFDRGLTNGTLGQYVGDRTIQFDDIGNVILDQENDHELIDLAYAMTVHKSQGSQWQRVIVIVHPNKLLERSALYTAITRASEQVILLGNRDTFAETVQSQNAADCRQTALKAHIQKCQT
nr:AAA family ATPase [uncultured Cohaesibacter sp.]